MKNPSQEIAIINRRLRTQHGLITRQQALDIGLSPGKIGRRISRGDWEVVRPGVYRHTATEWSYRSRCLAAVLGRTAIVSHTSAAALLGLEPFKQPRIEITVPHGFRKSDQRVHVSNQWLFRDEVTPYGIPCTGVERTILDCAAIVSLEVLEEMAESAILQSMTSWPRLNEYLACYGTQGRNGTAALRKLLRARAGTPDVPRSAFSRKVARLLVEAGLPAPVVEHQVLDGSGNHILYLDLAWPDLMKAWELDGLRWHFHRPDVIRDRQRRNDVKAQGWAIQEIVWDVYRDSPQQLVDWAIGFLTEAAA